MKKTGILLTLAASLLLTGCSAMLERDYSHVTPHNAAPTTEGDPSILRAESYQELVNALVYLVNLGAERGTIRLYTDSEDVEDFLSDACLEVVQEDPLGAYCVEFITYSVDPVVTFSQAEVDITYRRTREQVASIVQATGAAAIRSELGTALTSFAPERTLRIHYFEEDEAFIQDLARQAYYDAPAFALGLPEISAPGRRPGRAGGGGAGPPGGLHRLRPLHRRLSRQRGPLPGLRRPVPAAGAALPDSPGHAGGIAPLLGRRPDPRGLAAPGPGGLRRGGAATIYRPPAPGAGLYVGLRHPSALRLSC